jgi:hypothetical protein
MTTTRWSGWVAIGVGICFSILWGTAVSRNLPTGRLADFKGIYYPARCLLEGNDPYKDGEILRLYVADGGKFPTDPEQLRIFRRSVGTAVNLPTTFVLATPLALLPLQAAELVWVALVAFGLTLAAWLIWRLAEPCSPAMASLLLAILLANSGILFVAGNTAGLVIGLCGIAVWCFLEERFLWAGVLCMGLSLAIKPHDTGFVWLYFLLAGGAQRKRSLQALGIAAAIGLVMAVWVSLVAPHWLAEMKDNLAVITARGDLNDPGPAGLSRHSADVIVDLQAAVSIFKDDPGFYNTISYLICGALTLLWALRVLRARPSRDSAFIGIAVAAALSMLPAYHRGHDAKLLMLAVPACAMLWSRGERVARMGALTGALCVIMMGDIPLAAFVVVSNAVLASTAGLPRLILTVLLTREAPLILLATSIFYLWLFWRFIPASRGTAPVLRNLPVDAAGARSD